MIDYDLTKKFAQNLHLNVADRKLLDGGKIRGAVLCQAIADIVEENGKYPMTWNIDEPFDGGLIEKIEAGHYKPLFPFNSDFVLPTAGKNSDV